MYKPTMAQRKTAVYLLLMPIFASFSYQSAKLANFHTAKQLLGLPVSSNESYPQVGLYLDIRRGTGHDPQGVKSDTRTRPAPTALTAGRVRL
ncbi:hypothetical protein C8K36_101196 [Rhodococcus sp. OK519]|nr:hypothetical protein C8K36_101196 [Rhodococcus sp. OK519]